MQTEKHIKDMSEAEIKVVKEAANCTLYTIQFVNDTMDEFEKFYTRFKGDLLYNPDLMRIVQILGRIGEVGALERFFRPEGKMRDHVCALPVLNSKLRLYCLRLSDKILILGNGGVKNTRAYEESNELKGYVLTLQKFDEIIRQGEADGSIVVSENIIETDNVFEL